MLFTSLWDPLGNILSKWVGKKERSAKGQNIKFVEKITRRCPGLNVKEVFISLPAPTGIESS